MDVPISEDVSADSRTRHLLTRTSDGIAPCEDILITLQILTRKCTQTQLMHPLPMLKMPVTPATYTYQIWEQNMQLKWMIAQQIRRFEHGYVPKFYLS
jgi:hypothetical protein